MVAYSFQTQFAAPIAAGSKRQTIRADRKRHARLGETLQLYTGMRSRKCRLVGRAICIGVGPVRLDFRAEVVSLWTGVTLAQPDELSAYAVRDGFGDWREMVSFWRTAHPDAPAFCGVAIEWGETFEAATN
jgi:hypothetical protein